MIWLGHCGINVTPIFLHLSEDLITAFPIFIWHTLTFTTWDLEPKSIISDASLFNLAEWVFIQSLPHLNKIINCGWLGRHFLDLEQKRHNIWTSSAYFIWWWFKRATVHSDRLKTTLDHQQSPVGLHNSEILDLALWIHTCCWRLDMYDLSYCNVTPRRPREARIFNRMSWLIVSNADDKSKENTAVIRPTSFPLEWHRRD